MMGSFAPLVLAALLAAAGAEVEERDSVLDAVLLRRRAVRSVRHSSHATDFSESIRSKGFGDSRRRFGDARRRTPAPPTPSPTPAPPSLEEKCRNCRGCGAHSCHACEIGFTKTHVSRNDQRPWCECIDPTVCTLPGTKVTVTFLNGDKCQNCRQCASNVCNACIKGFAPGPTSHAVR